jgi:GMP synthase (glutamine-hydrolysing)
VTDHDLVLVVDFGAQYAQLIARRVREARVFSEIVPHTMPHRRDFRQAAGGDGPVRRAVECVRRRGTTARSSDLRPRSPVFGICYGFQLMAQGLGGEVAQTGGAGVRCVHRSTSSDRGVRVLRDCPSSTRCGCPTGTPSRAAPSGLDVTRLDPGRLRWPPSRTSQRRLAGVQWHPEVLHTEHGQQVMEHFLHDIAGCRRLVDDGQHHRGADRAHREPRSVTARDLWPVRWRRLRGGRRSRAARDR